MDKLVLSTCAKWVAECRGNCKGDCPYFGSVKEKLQKFGEDVSKGLAGKAIVIAELRQEGWYKRAVRDLQWNGYVVGNNTFKKIEEDLMNGLLGMWAQK
jgi:hypothetical protein